jgi:hypothetical protein
VDAEGPRRGRRLKPSGLVGEGGDGQCLRSFASASAPISAGHRRLQLKRRPRLRRGRTLSVRRREPARSEHQSKRVQGRDTKLKSVIALPRLPGETRFNVAPQLGGGGVFDGGFRRRRRWL